MCCGPLSYGHGSVEKIHRGRGKQVNIPEGWKLVPVEPTGEMRVAAEHEIDRAAIHNYGGAPSYEDIWNWMLAAAPTPPAQEVEPVGYVSKNYIERNLAESAIHRQGFVLEVPLYTTP